MENLMHQLQEYFYNQFPIIEQNNLIVIITALVIALLYVFFGYKLLRVYISLLGFLIGFALGIVICAVSLSACARSHWLPSDSGSIRPDFSS